MPDFLCKDMEPAKLLSEERVEYCLKGWRNVLTEHPKAFSEEPLGRIAETINDIINGMNSCMEMRNPGSVAFTIRWFWILIFYRDGVINILLTRSFTICS